MAGIVIASVVGDQPDGKRFQLAHEGVLEAAQSGKDDGTTSYQKRTRKPDDSIRVDLLKVRLALEVHMKKQLVSCCFFSMYLATLMAAAGLSATVTDIYSVHQNLNDQFGTDSIATLMDKVEMWEYVNKYSATARYLSPASNVYFADQYAKVWLPAPTDFPPSMTINDQASPRLFEDFTLAAWVKTTNPTFSILRRAMRNPGGVGDTCWDIGTHGIIYGAHEGRLAYTMTPMFSKTLPTNVLPAADPAGALNDYVTPDDSPTLTDLLTDGNWHHFAVTVKNDTTRFYVDGKFDAAVHNPNFIADTALGKYYGSSHVTQAKPKPVLFQQITDCADGVTQLGDETFEGSMVDVKYWPRALKASEVDDVVQIGLPLDDFVSGGGAVLATNDAVGDVLDRLSHLEPKLDGIAGSVRSDTDQSFKESVAAVNAHTTQMTLQCQAPAPAKAVAPPPPDDAEITYEDVVNALSGCSDDVGFRDFMDDGCQWYFMNTEDCAYSDFDTKMKCAVTCNMCGYVYVKSFFELFDNGPPWDVWTYSEVRKIYKFMRPTFTPDDWNRTLISWKVDADSLASQTVSLAFLQDHIDIVESIADPLLDSAGAPPRFLLDDALVTLLTEAKLVDLPTATLDDEDNLKDNAVAFVAWIKDFQDQGLLSLRKKGSPIPCFTFGPLKLPASMQADTPWWGYRAGEYKYQRVFSDNATKMWDFFTKDMGPSVYGDAADDEYYPDDRSGIESPPHAPSQIPVPNVGKAISEWVVDGKWHHVAFQINYTHVTFIVDGATRGPQPLLLETDVCSEILDPATVGTVDAEMAKFDQNREALGVPSPRQLSGESALLPGKRLVDALRGRKLMRSDLELVVGERRDPRFNKPLQGKIAGLVMYEREVLLEDIQTAYNYGMLGGQQQLQGRLETPPATAQLDVSAYGREMLAIVPPIIMQRRGELKECDDGDVFALKLSSYMDSNFALKCGDQYECNFPASTVSPGEIPTNNHACMDRTKDNTDDHFSRQAVELLGMQWFVELLYLFDAELVYRDNGMQVAQEWVDPQTKEVMILNIFYTPEKRIGTVMTVNFFLEEDGMDGKFALRSFLQMSAEEKVTWTVLLIITIVLSFLHFVFTVASMIRGRRFVVRSSEVAIKSFDIALQLAILVYCAIDLARRTILEDTFFDNTFAKLIEVDWRDETKDYEEKMYNFFNTVEAVSGAIDDRERMQIAGAVILFACFYRVVLYLSAHPRIAALVNTISLATDKLFHFLVSFVPIFLILAFIAYWLFGSDYAEYSTYQLAIWTQVQMIFGNTSWEDVSEGDSLVIFYAFYLVSFLIFVNLFLINFFLAIVVDAYVTVMKSVDSCPVDRNFIVDVWWLFLYAPKKVFYRIPTAQAILHDIITVHAEAVKESRSIGGTQHFTTPLGESTWWLDLAKVNRMECFKDRPQVARVFFEHYLKMDWLQVELPRDEEEEEESEETPELSAMLDVQVGDDFMGARRKAHNEKKKEKEEALHKSVTNVQAMLHKDLNEVKETLAHLQASVGITGTGKTVSSVC